MLRVARKCLLFSGLLLAVFPANSAAQENGAAPRLLNAEEGSSIVSAAWEHSEQVRRKPDCSHLVHRVYELAGFPYPYASSFDLYHGVDSFRRVAAPHVGDLVVWRGHVGIVVDPVQRSFYSSVRSGARTEYYDEAYWRARGRPRFYRYILAGAGTLLAANSSAPARVPEARPGVASVPVPEESADPATQSVERTESAAGSATLAPAADGSFEVPSSIFVAAAADRPTRDEVGEAVSELNSAAGNLLRHETSSHPARSIVIYDQLSVERLEIKSNRGWAHVQVAGRFSIAGEKFERKVRREKLRWELRRTSQGWELLAPPNRAYVPRDIAVRVLASQLALLTQNEAASEDLDHSLRQETRIVRVLGFLFDLN